MSNRLDRRPLSIQEEQAYNEAKAHIAEHFKQFPFLRVAVERMERNMAKIAVAANMAAATGPSAHPINTEDGKQWHRDVDLMDNVYLCHRLLVQGTEYAVIQYFPKSSRHEIWHQGHNAIEVLSLFIREQQHVLKVWREDMTVQVGEFLLQNYPDQNLSKIAGRLMDDLSHAAPTQSLPMTGAASNTIRF